MCAAPNQDSHFNNLELGFGIHVRWCRFFFKKQIKYKNKFATTLLHDIKMFRFFLCRNVLFDNNSLKILHLCIYIRLNSITYPKKSSWNSIITDHAYSVILGNKFHSLNCTLSKEIIKFKILCEIHSLRNNLGMAHTKCDHQMKPVWLCSCCCSVWNEIFMRV